MVDLLHEIEIKASAARVLAAISTQTGLGSWWTTDNESRPEVGHINIFRFNQGAVEFHFRVDRHSSDGLQWTCVEAAKVPTEWIDTKITFDLNETEGVTIVKLGHRNWERNDGALALCNTTWGMLMHHLRDYVENGTVNPYFTG